MARAIQAAIFPALILSIFLSACSHPPEKRSDPATDLLAAQELQKRGSYGLSRALLEPYLEQDLDPETDSKVHYTLGLALFYIVRDELEGQLRDLGRAMGFLSTQQVDYLNNAAGHFRMAVKAYPSGKAAPESLYLLGLLHDFGYLQRFDESMMYYQRCFDEYPGTEAARRAEERYGILKEISGGIEGTPHGK